MDVVDLYRSLNPFIASHTSNIFDCSLEMHLDEVINRDSSEGKPAER